MSEGIETCQPNEKKLSSGGVDLAGGCGRCEPARKYMGCDLKTMKQNPPGEQNKTSKIEEAKRTFPAGAIAAVRLIRPVSLICFDTLTQCLELSALKHENRPLPKHAVDFPLAKTRKVQTTPRSARLKAGDFRSGSRAPRRVKPGAWARHRRVRGATRGALVLAPAETPGHPLRRPGRTHEGTRRNAAGVAPQHRPPAPDDLETGRPNSRTGLLSAPVSKVPEPFSGATVDGMAER